MSATTISKNITKGEELVIIPRKEYEEFLELKKLISVAKPTKAELRILGRGQREIKAGKYVEWRKLKNELENLRYGSR